MATVNSLICFGGLNGKTVTFTDAGDVVNLTTHGLRNGAAVFLTTDGALPTGLSQNTLYYARQGADDNKLTLHTSEAGAIAGTGQVTFTGTGTGTHKLKSSLIFTGADLSRYDNARVYNGLSDWNSSRSGASAYDVEVAEIGESFADVVSSGIVISIPSAQNIITTMINGIRSAGFHNANYPATTLAGMTLSTGYVFYNTGPVSGGGAVLKLNRYRDTVDGIIIMNKSGSSVSYGIDLNVQCRCLRSIIVSSVAQAAGIYMRAALSEASGNIVCGWTAGAAFTTAQPGLLFTNNLLTKNTNGFSAADGTKGFFYNNISVGNTTSNWPTQPSQLEGASNNAGLSGQAWMTSGGSRITIATTDFVNHSGNDFRAASASSPQVEAGVSFYGYMTEDAAGRYMPDYMDGGAAAIDVGPLEYDHGYGPWPTDESRGLAFTGLVAGSTVRVFITNTTTELFSTTSSGTSETWSEDLSGSRVVDYTIFKDGYIPIRVTGVTVTGAASGGVLGTPIQQKASRAYQASSGLTFGSNATITVGTKTVTTSVSTTVQNYYSFACESWRSESSLRNVAFPFSENGQNSFQLSDGWAFSSGSIQYLSRDGMRYVNSSNVVTDVWAAILSVGVPAGKTVRYKQSDGGTVQSAENTGNMDQLVKIYQAGSFDYSGFLVLKVQADGYDQAEFDAVATYGTLDDQLFVVSLTPVANGISAGTVTGITITDHGASPVTWNGKAYSITITDTGVHSGEEIVQYVRGLNSFNYHDLVQTNGTEFKTVRGKLYGDTGATLKGVRVVQSDGTTSHADFNLHTADDGTAYIPPLPPAAAEATILADSRVQLFNVTTDTEIDNVFVTGTGYSYVITSEASDGDTLRLRVCKLGREPAESLAVWGASGATFLISQPEDSIYTAWGIDGSAITEFTGDVTGHIYIDANDLDGMTTKTRLGAWYSWVLTTEIGIRHFFGGVSYLSTAAIRINTDVADILIENVNASTALRFTDMDVRLYRSDGTSIIAPTSYSIHNDYSGVPDVVETGVSGLTTAESNVLMGLPGTVSTIEKIARNKMITDPATGVLTVYDDDGSTPLMTANIFKDAAGTVPYNGTGAERRERLA